MTQRYNIFGGPGTGKTRYLIQKFIELARILGPDRVAAVTYTRAAAQEFTQRAERALGLPPSTPRKPSLPYVGTIHSLCYRQLGRPKLVDDTNIREFAEQAEILPAENEHRLWDDPDESLTELALVRQLIATAQQRIIDYPQAFRLLPLQAQGQVDEHRLIGLALEYRNWKVRSRLLDFEDLLWRGSQQALPVQALLVDECQDNTPLLWSVLDAWAQNTKIFVCAGDPWQALYQYLGAEADTFRQRPGKWITLRTSHRLPHPSVEYAQKLLAEAGWDNDPLVRSWEGIGGVEREGGSRLFLARTHKLVKLFERRLIDEGLPFVHLQGRSPFETRAAQMYRLLEKLRLGSVIEAKQILGLLQKDTPWAPAFKARYQHDPEAPVDDAAFTHICGSAPQEAQAELPWADYLARVRDRFGSAGLLLKPKAALSTIHGAKGREADYVTLLRNWGRVPSEALADPRTGRGEACVAYVGVTRHRALLQLLDGGRGGMPYPFPERE